MFTSFLPRLYEHREEFDVNNVRASHKFEKINYSDLMLFIRSIDFIKINNNLMDVNIRHRLNNKR